jgi:hypothetical protein
MEIECDVDRGGVGRLGMAGDYLLAIFLCRGVVSGRQAEDAWRQASAEPPGGWPHSVAVPCDMAVEFFFGSSLSVTTLAFLEYSEGHETTDHC